MAVNYPPFVVSKSLLYTPYSVLYALSLLSEVEYGFECFKMAVGPDKCITLCGDGDIIYGVEACDDGNTQPGDGCSDTCEIEEGYFCIIDPIKFLSVCEPRCGDGLLRYPETCDDGNALSDDGCNQYCEVAERAESARSCYSLSRYRYSSLNMLGEHIWLSKFVVLMF